MNFRKSASVIGLIITLASMATGCSIFGGEKDNIDVAPSPVIESVFPYHQLWNNSLSGNQKIYSLLSPAESNSIIYAAGRSGQVKGIDFLNGNTLWETNLSNNSLFNKQSALLSGGISVSDNAIFIGSERAILYALNKTDGSILWKKETKGEIIANPAVSDDKVIIRTSNGYLQSFNKDTGDNEWSINDEEPVLSLRGQSSPVVAYGAVIFGDDTGHVNAYFAKDGQLIWQQRISQPSGSTEIAKLNDVDSMPIVENNLVYAVGYNGDLVVLELSNGQIVWKKALSSVHDFTLTDTQIFAIDQDDALYALAKNDGTVLWKQSDLLHRQLTDPVIFENHIVVGDMEGFLYLIDPESGDVTAKTEVSSSGLASKPLVIDGKLIIQAKDGNVYAYGQ